MKYVFTPCVHDSRAQRSMDNTARRSRSKVSFAYLTPIRLARKTNAVSAQRRYVDRVREQTGSPYMHFATFARVTIQ